MKKLLCLFILGILSLAAYSQDLIVKKDGSVIQAKVAEIGTSEVKYKKWSNQDGPTYSIAIADILAINYQNGEKEELANIDVDNHSESKAPMLIEKGPSGNNQTLIGLYENDVHIKNPKPQNKPADNGIIVFGFAPNSILSNEDIEIAFERSTVTHEESGSFVPLFRYEIKISNKTNKTVYVDLANCFRIPNIGNTYCYFNGENISITQSHNGGHVLNMGAVTGALGIGGAIGVLASGLTVGQNHGSSVSKTFDQQRIITIPPHGHRTLSEFKYEIKAKKTVGYNQWILVSKGEEFCFADMNTILPENRKTILADYWRIHMKKGVVNKDHTKQYTIEDSPFTINYVITYSTSENFETYSYLPFALYAKTIVGHEKMQGMHGLSRAFTYFSEWGWEFEFDKLSPYTIFGPVMFE